MFYIIPGDREVAFNGLRYLGADPRTASVVCLGTVPRDGPGLQEVPLSGLSFLSPVSGRSQFDGLKYWGQTRGLQLQQFVWEQTRGLQRLTNVLKGG